MWDRIRRSRFTPWRAGQESTSRARRRLARRLHPEVLEDRLLPASLQPIAGLTVPAQQGYALALDGSGSIDAQTFTVTSSNPDIAASLASGPFWTINAQYTDPVQPANSFSGPLTFQLFENLTPNTVSQIEAFSDAGYYNGKSFTRVTAGFPGASDYIVQGGAPNSNGTGSSGQPGTPFANENVQQLAFTGKNQLAMANAGGTNTNDTQFFITTTGSPHFLDYGYTLFGQLVSGLNTLTQMTAIPLQYSPIYKETSSPVNPLIMSSVSRSTTNPNGVLLLDMAQAKPGETSTINVTATDPTDGSTQVRSFTVTVGAYAGPLDPKINFKPFNGGPVTVSMPNNATTSITLPAGQSGYPDTNHPSTLSYTLVSQPSHGTISNFNASAGTFTYSPSSGFAGTDTFQYRVTATGPLATAATTTSNPASITITVNATTPTITWANPTNIVYGTALSATQLDATASVPGTFVYTPPAGTVLHAGQGQTLSVTFTPNNTSGYTTAIATATINVLPATPAITWANPADIVYGTALSATQLDATASVAGTFTYTPAAGTVLSAGNNQTLSVTFTPTDTTNYATAGATATINVLPTPTSTTTPPPLVNVTSIQLVKNKKHQVTGILVSFSGAINAAEAANLATYRLATAGKRGSFTAKNAGVIKLKSAIYNPANNTVTLVPKKALTLSKPVQLQIAGSSPSGLQDSLGRLIDGDHNGTAGGNAVAMLAAARN